MCTPIARWVRGEREAHSGWDGMGWMYGSVGGWVGGWMYGYRIYGCMDIYMDGLLCCLLDYDFYIPFSFYQLPSEFLAIKSI